MKIRGAAPQERGVFAFDWDLVDGRKVAYDDETQEWTLGGQVEGRMSALLARYVLAKIINDDGAEWQRGYEAGVADVNDPEHGFRSGEQEAAPPLSPPIEMVRALVGWLKNWRPCPECGEGVNPPHPSYPMTHEPDCEVGQTLDRARSWLREQRSSDPTPWSGEPAVWDDERQARAFLNAYEGFNPTGRGEPRFPTESQFRGMVAHLATMFRGAREAAQRLPDGCCVSPLSSRMCSRGTKACDVAHPNGEPEVRGTRLSRGDDDRDRPAYCPSMWDGWVCTREPGHLEWHHASNGSRICAVWFDLRGTRSSETSGADGTGRAHAQDSAARPPETTTPARGPEEAGTSSGVRPPEAQEIGERHPNAFSFDWDDPLGTIAYDDETQEWTINGRVEGRMSGLLARARRIRARRTSDAQPVCPRCDSTECAAAKDWSADCPADHARGAQAGMPEAIDPALMQRATEFTLAHVRDLHETSTSAIRFRACLAELLTEVRDAAVQEGERRAVAAEQRTRTEERERAIRCCLYVAKEWRDEYPPGSWDDRCRALRERSAEAAELCASRIGWSRPTSAKEGT